MNKVILLVPLVPVLALGQTMENKAQVAASPGDLIISEIMADPNPPVSLPIKEFVEIFNRTNYTFNLKDWTLSDGNSKCTFTEKPIFPGEYFIICQTNDSSLFKKYGKTMGVKSFPALTDDGKVLYLCDNSGKMIHGVEYSSHWYGDDLKSDGGWSLEMIDTDYPFSEAGNWHASISKEGGTPGKVNSVSGRNPDMAFYGIENTYPIDTISVYLKLSETVFGFSDNLGKIKIDDRNPKKITAADPLLRSWILHLETPLRRGQIYTVRIEDSVTDFAGNRMRRNEFRFGITEYAQRGNILFNELLFNPLPGEPDYIEIYNCSNIVVDASDLFFVSVNDEENDTSSVVWVSKERRCIIPGDYYAITTSRQQVTERYTSSDPDRIFEVSSLPSMPDDNGHLILYNRKTDKIDELFYDYRMHYSLLSGEEGIALEKVRKNAPSTDKSLWHSASEASGWGTPGAPNSVLMEQSVANDLVTFSSSRITPDNDGIEDFLVIDLKLAGIGNIVSINIFDETGGFVKRLTDNMLAGQQASIIWNGTAIDEKLVSTGIYIFLITVFDDKGKVERLKKVCSVIRR